MDTVWMLAEICGPEKMIQSMHATKQSAIDRKRELIEEHRRLMGNKYTQRYSDSLLIEQWEVKP